MKRVGLVIPVAVGAACSGPAVGLDSNDGGSSGSSAGTTESDSTASSPGSSSSASAEGSTSLIGSSSSSSSSPGSTTSVDSSSSSSGGEVLDGPGCEAPPPCDRGTFEGGVRIESADQIADIAGYTGIRGALEVVDSDLECLDFLGCLQETGRDVLVFGNPELRSTEGLAGLQRVGVLTADEGPFDREGSIIISENPALERLGGFVAISEVARSVLVVDNASLETMTGFTGLEVAAELVVSFNPQLRSLVGLHPLKGLHDGCQITNNTELCLSEAFEVCGDLDPSPSAGNTQNNRDDC